MNPVKVGLLGLGTVGGGTFNVLSRNADEISRRAGRGIVVSHAAAREYDAGGLPGIDGIDVGDDAFALVQNPDVDIIVELIGGYEPARELVLQAIANGKHVVTANKALIAMHGNEIFAAAQDKGVMVAFEAAVAGGIPIIKALREGLSANRIEWLTGIINGTGNFILTEMRDKGSDFADVLKEAQALGYAEADPTADVEGWDAVAKTIILANAILGGELKVSDVEREGITDISSERIRAAKSKGKRIKLIAEAYSENGVVRAKVGPKQVPLTNPFAVISGTLNALTVITDGLGDVTVIGGGAGGEGTAHGLLSDIIAIFRVRARTNSSRHLT